jgi:hypothetical protein
VRLTRTIDTDHYNTDKGAEKASEREERQVKVSIKSVFTDQVWEGELEPPAELETARSVLEWLFRRFNRVDEEDVQRLEDAGFTQPSMSVGDEVTMDGDRWVVNTLGFSEVH